MQQISLGPFVTCFLVSIILVGYLRFILSQEHGIFKYYSKIIFFIFVLIMIRMLAPINFSFTQSIYSTKIMNTLGILFYFNLTENIQLFDVLVWIWICGSFIQLLRYSISRKKTRIYLNKYVLSTHDLETKHLDFFLSKIEMEKFKIACVPENVTPSIFGAMHPIIVLPKNFLLYKDIELILQHEICHYYNHDLHLKIILDILVAIYWWNPFIYQLRKNLDITIEFSNDYRLSKDLDIHERIQYAESLLRIAKENLLGTTYDFTLVKKTYLNERIQALLSDTPISKHKKRLSLILNFTFLSALMMIAFIFVPEAEYSLKPEQDFQQENAFSIDSENSYFIKTKTNYDLYVSDNYITSFHEIPIELEGIPVYEEKTN